MKKDPNLLLFKKRVEETLGKNLIKIILFGSRARYKADKYSDYDCIVVLKKCDNIVKEKILEIEGNMLYEKNAVFSAFPFSKRDLLKKKYEPFIMNATKEGVMI